MHMHRNSKSVNAVLNAFWSSFWIGTLAFLACAPVSADQSVLRVALFVDHGTESSEFRKEFERSDDDSFVYRRVDGDDISNGALKKFDALVVPGGSASTESRSMGAEARNEVRRFVEEGGIYMGVCAGAYLASQAAQTDIGMLPIKTLDKEHWYRVDDATKVDMELTPAGMEIFGITDRNIEIKYENGPIFAPLDKRTPSLTALGFFRSEVVADGGERGVMLGAPAIILAEYGRGTVLAISPHFEETRGYKQVQIHALHWLYEQRNRASTLKKRTDVDIERHAR